MKAQKLPRNSRLNAQFLLMALTIFLKSCLQKTSSPASSSGGDSKTSDNTPSNDTKDINDKDEELKKKITEIKKELLETTLKLEAAKEEVKNLKASGATVDPQIQQKQDEIDKLKTDVSGLGRDLNSMTSDRDNEKNLKDAAINDKTIAEQKKNAAENTASLEKLAKEAAEAEVKNLKATGLAVDPQIEQKQDQIDILTSEKLALENSLTTIKNERDDARKVAQAAADAQQAAEAEKLKSDQKAQAAVALQLVAEQEAKDAVTAQQATETEKLQADQRAQAAVAAKTTAETEKNDAVAAKTTAELKSLGLDGEVKKLRQELIEEGEKRKDADNNLAKLQNENQTLKALKKFVDEKYDNLYKFIQNKVADDTKLLNDQGVKIKTEGKLTEIEIIQKALEALNIQIKDIDTSIAIESYNNKNKATPFTELNADDNSAVITIIDNHFTEIKKNFYEAYQIAGNALELKKQELKNKAQNDLMALKTTFDDAKKVFDGDIKKYKSTKVTKSDLDIIKQSLTDAHDAYKNSSNLIYDDMPLIDSGELKRIFDDSVTKSFAQVGEITALFQSLITQESDTKTALDDIITKAITDINRKIANDGINAYILDNIKDSKNSAENLINTYNTTTLSNIIQELTKLGVNIEGSVYNFSEETPTTEEKLDELVRIKTYLTKAKEEFEAKEFYKMDKTYLENLGDKTQLGFEAEKQKLTDALKTYNDELQKVIAGAKDSSAKDYVLNIDAWKVSCKLNIVDKTTKFDYLITCAQIRDTFEAAVKNAQEDTKTTAKDKKTSIELLQEKYKEDVDDYLTANNISAEEVITFNELFAQTVDKKESQTKGLQALADIIKGHKDLNDGLNDLVKKFEDNPEAADIEKDKQNLIDDYTSVFNKNEENVGEIEKNKYAIESNNPEPIKKLDELVRIKSQLNIARSKLEGEDFYKIDDTYLKNLGDKTQLGFEAEKKKLTDALKTYNDELQKVIADAKDTGSKDYALDITAWQPNYTLDITDKTTKYNYLIELAGKKEALEQGVKTALEELHKSMKTESERDDIIKVLENTLFKNYKDEFAKDIKDTKNIDEETIKELFELTQYLTDQVSIFTQLNEVIKKPELVAKSFEAYLRKANLSPKEDIAKLFEKAEKEFTEYNNTLPQIIKEINDKGKLSIEVEYYELKTTALEELKRELAQIASDKDELDKSKKALEGSQQKLVEKLEDAANELTPDANFEGMSEDFNNKIEIHNKLIENKTPINILDADPWKDEYKVDGAKVIEDLKILITLREKFVRFNEYIKQLQEDHEKELKATSASSSAPKKDFSELLTKSYEAYIKDLEKSIESEKFTLEKKTKLKKIFNADDIVKDAQEYCAISSPEELKLVEGLELSKKKTMEEAVKALEEMVKDPSKATSSKKLEIMQEIMQEVSIYNSNIISTVKKAYDGKSFADKMPTDEYILGQYEIKDFFIQTMSSEFDSLINLKTNIENAVEKIKNDTKVEAIDFFPTNIQVLIGFEFTKNFDNFDNKYLQVKESTTQATEALNRLIDDASVSLQNTAFKSAWKSHFIDYFEGLVSTFDYLAQLRNHLIQLNVKLQELQEKYRKGVKDLNQVKNDFKSYYEGDYSNEVNDVISTYESLVLVDKILDASELKKRFLPENYLETVNKGFDILAQVIKDYDKLCEQLLLINKTVSSQEQKTKEQVKCDNFLRTLDDNIEEAKKLGVEISKDEYITIKFAEGNVYQLSDLESEGFFGVENNSSQVNDHFEPLFVKTAEGKCILMDSKECIDGWKNHRVDIKLSSDLSLDFQLSQNVSTFVIRDMDNKRLVDFLEESKVSDILILFKDFNTFFQLIAMGNLCAQFNEISTEVNSPNASSTIYISTQTTAIKKILGYFKSNPNPKMLPDDAVEYLYYFTDKLLAYSSLAETNQEILKAKLELVIKLLNDTQNNLVSDSEAYTDEGLKKKIDDATSLPTIDSFMTPEEKTEFGNIEIKMYYYNSKDKAKGGKKVTLTNMIILKDITATLKILDNKIEVSRILSDYTGGLECKTNLPGDKVLELSTNNKFITILLKKVVLIRELATILSSAEKLDNKIADIQNLRGNFKDKNLQNFLKHLELLTDQSAKERALDDLYESFVKKNILLSKDVITMTDNKLKNAVDNFKAIKLDTLNASILKVFKEYNDIEEVVVEAVKEEKVAEEEIKIETENDFSKFFVYYVKEIDGKVYPEIYYRVLSASGDNELLKSSPINYQKDEINVGDSKVTIKFEKLKSGAQYNTSYNTSFSYSDITNLKPEYEEDENGKPKNVFEKVVVLDLSYQFLTSLTASFFDPLTMSGVTLGSVVKKLCDEDGRGVFEYLPIYNTIKEKFSSKFINLSSSEVEEKVKKLQNELDSAISGLDVKTRSEVDEDATALNSHGMDTVIASSTSTHDLYGNLCVLVNEYCTALGNIFDPQISS